MPFSNRISPQRCENFREIIGTGQMFPAQVRRPRQGLPKDAKVALGLVSILSIWSELTPTFNSAQLTASSWLSTGIFSPNVPIDRLIVMIFPENCRGIFRVAHVGITCGNIKCIRVVNIYQAREVPPEKAVPTIAAMISEAEHQRRAVPPRGAFWHVGRVGHLPSSETVDPNDFVVLKYRIYHQWYWFKIFRRCILW